MHKILRLLAFWYHRISWVGKDARGLSSLNHRVNKQSLIVNYLSGDMDLGPEADDSEIAEEFILRGVKHVHVRQSWQLWMGYRQDFNDYHLQHSLWEWA